MPVISRIWARSALISAGLQPQQGKLEPGRLVSAIGLLIPQCRPGRTTKTPRLQGYLSRRSRSYGHSMGVNTPARKSALERQGTVDEGVPRHRTHDAVDADADRLLEGPHRALGLGPEDAVYLGPLGRVTRQVPGLELALNGPDGVTAAAVADLDDQRRPGPVSYTHLPLPTIY